MNERGILDTNAVILLTRLRDPPALPRVPSITAITLAELTAGPQAASDDTERAARQAVLQQAESDFDPIPFDEPRGDRDPAPRPSMRRDILAGSRAPLSGPRPPRTPAVRVAPAAPIRPTR